MRAPLPRVPHSRCSKYKFMEASHTDNRSRLRAKIPDIAASLDSVRMLQRKAAAGEDVTAFYNLADQVYARARITPQNRVREQVTWLRALAPIVRQGERRSSDCRAQWAARRCGAGLAQCAATRR